ncbi:hypothetical protein D0T92_06915 [Neisseria zalophi]|uniref:Uncharacterized protein n=1 Tax=Neisseria zalophi TaxID=640030 RepID=A0A5J6PYR0_9NEIS|nr:hypothetical protein D0T92_06915 [Neisseria zalophi]
MQLQRMACIAGFKVLQDICRYIGSESYLITFVLFFLTKQDRKNHLFFRQHIRQQAQTWL